MSATGQAGGDAATQGQQDGGQEAQAQQGGAELQPILDTLNQHGQTLGSLQEFLQQQQQEPGGQEPEAEPLDLSFLDQAEPGYDPEQAATRLESVINDRIEQGIQQGVQQHIQPLQEKISERELIEQSRDLVAEFPELGQAEVANQVVQQAEQFATANFPAEVAQVLADSPAFWKLVYTSGRAYEAAQKEGASDDAQAAHLEGGGGANPAGGQQPGFLEQLQQADGDRLGSRVLNFGA